MRGDNCDYTYIFITGFKGEVSINGIFIVRFSHFVFQIFYTNDVYFTVIYNQIEIFKQKTGKQNYKNIQNISVLQHNTKKTKHKQMCNAF